MRARHKLLKYLVVIVPIAFVFFNPFSDSLRRRLLDRYDLRWHSMREPGRRVQEITVHNSADGPIPKIRVHLDLESGSASPVADFTFTKFKSEYRASFLDSVANADILKKVEQPDVKIIAAALDTHSSQRTLNKLEQTLDEVLSSNLRNIPKSAEMIDNLKKSGTCANWHRSLNRACNDKKYPEESCRQARGILESWEGFKRHLGEEARKGWSYSSGAQVAYESDQLSPSSYADFTFDLAARETGILQVSYDPDPEVTVSAKADVTSSSTIGYANPVEGKEDLEAPLAVFLLKYHFWLLAGAFILIVLGLAFAWPEIRPKQLLPINRVVHTALSTDDHEYWEHVYKRYRFYILQQFREYRHLYAKPHSDDDPEVVLDFVRNMLTAAYNQNPTEFKARALKTRSN